MIIFAFGGALPYTNRLSRGEKNQVQKRNCDAAKNLVREYYGNNNLKKKGRGTHKTCNFEGIARHPNVNIMLYEQKKDREKDAGTVWRLVYGKIQHKNSLPTINMAVLGGHCFSIKEMNVLCNRW